MLALHAPQALAALPRHLGQIGGTEIGQLPPLDVAPDWFQWIEFGRMIFMSMLLEQYKKIKYLETAQYVRAVDTAPGK